MSFTIAQFRKLAFQLTSKVADRPFTLGDDLSVAVEASYLAGGAMPGSAYSYYWTRRPEYFVPPGPEWKDHVFGPGTWEGEHTLGNGKGTLSAAGTVALSQSTASQNSSGSAYDYVVETTVTDIDRQQIATTAHVLVHPASFYLGARFASNTASGWWSRFIPTNTATKLETVTVDPQGRPWKDIVEVTATLTLGSWKATEQQGVYGRINTRWDYVETPVSEQKLRTANGKVTWDFSVKEGGDYLLTVEAKDNLGRVAKTALRFYATGSNWVRRATETPSEIELMADKEEYFPGENARILVRSPVPEGKYLLTLEREGIYEQKIVELKGGQTLLEIPIKEEYLPVFYVALSSFTKREAPPTDYFEPDLGRPRSLFGLVGLRVSTKPVQLDVSVVPGQKAYQPGTKAEVTVKVTQNGQPLAGSEVTVLAVDRGVLDLIDYHVPSPLDFFYDPYNFPLAVHGDDSRRLLMKPVTYDTSKLTGGGGDKVNERRDFRPLALFEPFVVTDANGEARVSFDLPDSLTTYRLTAVALKGAKLGLSEGEMLVQNPLNVRTALPRRLRNRDTATAGVVLQNLSNQDQTVEVTASSDLLTIGAFPTRKVVVPASGVTELPFTLAATRAGVGKITFAVRSAVVNEDLTETVIVEQPLVKESFATVGTLGTSDAGGPASGQEGLVIPRTIAPGFGGLTLSASSSLRPYLEPALTRLLETRDSWKWRGDFAKLTASFAFMAEKTDAALVDQLLADLKARQLESGALTSSLRRPRVADALLSLLTAHLLEFAEQRQYPLAETPSLNRLLAYLATLKRDVDQSPYSQAYLALVLAQGGRNDKDFTAQVEALGDKLGLGGYGLLTQAYLAAGDRTAAERVHRRSKNFVQIGTQSVDVKNTAEVADGWSSEVAELALLLKNSVELGDDAGLIQRLAGSLNRSERYWQTRNDSLWTLLGFLPLLDAVQPGSGAVVRVQADTALVATLDLPAVAPQDQLFLGFDQAPLATLARDSTLALKLSKTGEAPVYYTSTLQYALPAETSLARDEGLEVTTRYETLDKKAVGERDLKPGETYRVRVDLSTTKRRQRLELLVPVPSGVEIVDPTFVTSGRHFEEDANENELTEDDWLWYFNTPETFALDNLMVYRWSDFAAGTRAVTFLVRATTPGIFPTPGASAQLELEPEVFGRSEGRLFVIKP